MTLSLGWRVARFLPALLILNACSLSDRPMAPRSRPEFAISDAVHEGGTPGFYFLPPMVAQPAVSGTFDADVATLNPAIAICDITNDANCGTSSATLIVFTSSSTPAITVDLTTPQYQVNWNTQGPGFSANHTYRVHVTAGASGARRELGFADVLLTTTPGQAKFLQTGDIIVLQDGRTLPIHVRIESGIPGSLAVSAARASLASGGTDLITATVQDLHGVLLGGATVVWSVTTTPVAGVADATQPLNPTSGQTGAAGTVPTTLKMGTTCGTATVAAASAGLMGSVTVSVSSNCWTTKVSMPTARALLGTGTVGGTVYAVGGNSNGTVLATVEAYDPNTNAWSPEASLPTARICPAVAGINGVLYAVGGDPTGNNNPVATVEAYDPATNTWMTRASMPTARYCLGVAVVNGILYAVGGAASNGTPLATLEAYDPTTNTWTTKASMPTARVDLGVAVINGILYAVGGFSIINNVGTNQATVEAYDPAANAWVTKASMPTARHRFGVGVINGILYAVGGQSSQSNPPTFASMLEAYDPSSDMWSTKAPMPTVRSSLGVTAINGVLYAVGGVTVSGALQATVEAYQP